MSWTQLQQAYLDHLAGLGRATATLDLTRRWLSLFADSCRLQGVTHPCGVAPTHLAAFQREMAWRPNGRGGLLSLSSQLQCMVMVRQWLRWAVGRGHLLVDPSHDLILRHPTRPWTRLLSVAEVELLLETPDATTPTGLRDRAVLDILYSTGLRRGECHRLDLADLDLPQGLLAVRRGKGGKSRLLPVLGRLAQTLTDYLQHGRPALIQNPREPALFLDRYGLRTSLQILYKLVLDHARRAGLGIVSPHRLRHAFATHLMDGGAQLVALQALLGHARLDTTEIYTRLAAPGLRREHRRTHPRA